MPSWIASLIDALTPLLARMGVDEATRPILALILLYLIATLVVVALLSFFWLARRRKAEAKTSAAVPTAQAEPAVVDAGEEVAPSTQPELSAPVIAAPGSLRSGLRKTAASLLGRLEGIFGERRALNAEQLEELEEVLVTADFGVATTQLLVAQLEKRFAGQAVASKEVFAALQEEICHLLQSVVAAPSAPEVPPEVLMVVGVNGVGKTTSIGKLARHFVQQGRKVLLAAGDTFRAAAAEQLAVWAERSGAGIVRHEEGGDPAAVAFDAIQAAQARKVDLLMVDTAGRLHTKANLMEELKKVRRVLDRAVSGAPHCTLLVVDATTGQNALVQARLFHEAVGIDGIVLTKLDGTARGGIVVAIAAELKIPVCYVGVGEGAEDLRPFDAEAFAGALFNHDEAA